MSYRQLDRDTYEVTYSTTTRIRIDRGIQQFLQSEDVLFYAKCRLFAKMVDIPTAEATSLLRELLQSKPDVHFTHFFELHYVTHGVEPGTEAACGWKVTEDWLAAAEAIERWGIVFQPCPDCLLNDEKGLEEGAEEHAHKRAERIDEVNPPRGTPFPENANIYLKCGCSKLAYPMPETADWHCHVHGETLITKIQPLHSEGG